MKPLNIFYSEPDPDRWIKYDHYPRKVVRRLLRGPHRPGGVMMVALNLMKGLDKIGVPYRFNDYRYIKKHPAELACIIGKHNVLNHHFWKNPILFGAGVFSHPSYFPDLFAVYPNIKKILLPGEWMRRMFAPYYGEDNLIVWPTGIDTEKWNINIKSKEQNVDFLIYDKILWEKDSLDTKLVLQIKEILDDAGLTYDIIKYGSYNHDILVDKLSKSRFVIFLCEHETQGLAYQQILSTNTPILAWDQEGYWQDPEFYPEKVKFQPVSSVPYWDDRCGIKFKAIEEFPTVLIEFLNRNKYNQYAPRSYILENLTLELCAIKYFKIAESLAL